MSKNFLSYVQGIKSLEQALFWFIENADGCADRTEIFFHLKSRMAELAHQRDDTIPHKIVVVVRGGLVEAISSTDASAQAIVLDHDNIEQGDPPAERTYFPDGSSVADALRTMHGIY